MGEYAGSQNSGATLIKKTYSNLEMLPIPAPWTDAPTCPAWGSMDGFYSLGIQDTQVLLVLGYSYTVRFY